MQYGLGGGEILAGAALSLFGMPQVGIPMALGGIKQVSGSGGSSSTSGAGGGGGLGGLMSMLPLAGLFGGQGRGTGVSPFVPAPQLAQPQATQAPSLGAPMTPATPQNMTPQPLAALQPAPNRLPSGANQMSPDDELTAFLAARGIAT